jgi:hypothetical protein
MFGKIKNLISTQKLNFNNFNKYLSAPSGSVESERLFSQAKYITTDLRKRLSSENLKKILFVHDNLPLIDYNY